MLTWWRWRQGQRRVGLREPVGYRVLDAALDAMLVTALLSLLGCELAASASLAGCLVTVAVLLYGGRDQCRTR